MFAVVLLSVVVVVIVIVFGGLAFVFIMCVRQSNTNSMFGDVFVHHTVIHAEGFRSLNEGELVEFTVILNEEHKWHATSVTGPNGAYVEGLSKFPLRHSQPPLHTLRVHTRAHTFTHTHSHTHTLARVHL